MVMPLHDYFEIQMSCPTVRRPIVVHVPHAGTIVPDEIRARFVAGARHMRRGAMLQAPVRRAEDVAAKRKVHSGKRLGSKHHCAETQCAASSHARRSKSHRSEPNP
mgnify:CR=1 FL=1